MRSRFFSSGCALALLCAAGTLSAQEIAKPVEEEGRTTFSDQPAPAPAPRRTIAPRRGGKVDVSEAARRLEQAQRARMQGLEPRPGEFVRVSGSKTLNYRYWQRQEKLRLAVEQAQRRSLDTRRHASRNIVLVRASLGS
jgi:hypothetical protein